MSKQTPRKSRHKHNASNSGHHQHHRNSGPRQMPASDYESDAAHYMETRDAPPAIPRARSNTDLNFSVLRRYLPDLQVILSIAANAVAYTYSEDRKMWEKNSVEGTMFVCEREKAVIPVPGRDDVASVPRTSVFILNRKGMENLEVDLWRVSDCEMAGELLVFQLEDEFVSNSDGDEGGASSEERKVVGIWLHADEEDTRETNTKLIMEKWKQAKTCMDALIQAATSAAGVGLGEPVEYPQVVEQPPQAAPEAVGQVVGRRLSVTDLFGQRNGGG